MRNAFEEPAPRFVPLRAQQLEDYMGAGPGVRNADHIVRSVRWDAFLFRILGGI
jgi:hypothetical protein